MLRLISFLLGSNYEPCKSCEVLKHQLEITNNEKRDLLDTLLNFMKPKVEVQPPIQLEPLQPKFASFTRRRAALEEAARVKSQIEKSHLAATEDKSIEKLEEEVGINAG